MDEETKPCETCGEPIQFHLAKTCDSCHAVEARLDRYLSYSRGREYVKEALKRVSVRWEGIDKRDRYT